MGRATKRSRSEHVELRRLAEQLVASLDDDAAPDGTAVRSLLSRLTAALKVHLTQEMQTLYPKLLQHPNDEVRALAERMIPRLKDTYEGFLTFHDAWTADKIREAPDTFIKQARFVVKALHDTTLREEETIYPQVDAGYETLDLGPRR